MTELFDAAAVAHLERQIDGWLAALAADSDTVVAVDRAAVGDVPSDQPRWYVRTRGEAKDYTTIWLTLGQRTLRYETYVMPAPEENCAAVHENLLRRNADLVGAHFAIGAEEAIYLCGEVPNAALNAAELDRIVGSLYAYVERCFAALLRLGFGSRFRR